MAYMGIWSSIERHPYASATLVRAGKDAPQKDFYTQLISTITVLTSRSYTHIVRRSEIYV